MVGAGLGLMWVWTGVAYHAMFFAPINKAANAFAALFVVQGLLFAHAALVRSDLCFSRKHGPRAWLGWALIVYSALIYPLIGFAGHGYPAMPMFGITPCPVTLFSFGVLLLAQDPVPRRLLVIPFALGAGGRQRRLPAGRAAGLALARQRTAGRALALAAPSERATRPPLDQSNVIEPDQCVEAQPGQRQNRDDDCEDDGMVPPRTMAPGLGVVATEEFHARASLSDHAPASHRLTGLQCRWPWCASGTCGWTCCSGSWRWRWLCAPLGIGSCRWS